MFCTSTFNLVQSRYDFLFGILTVYKMDFKFGSHNLTSFWFNIVSDFVLNIMVIANNTSRYSNFNTLLMYYLQGSTILLIHISFYSIGDNSNMWYHKAYHSTPDIPDFAPYVGERFQIIDSVL